MNNPDCDVACSSLCLRCQGINLRILAATTEEIAFFECPSCFRHYAKKDGGTLTFRWLHPISLALYGVMYELQPVEHSRRIAHSLVRSRKPLEIAGFTREIELELDSPTQNVREILGNVAPEEECRNFLAEVVQKMKAAI